MSFRLVVSGWQVVMADAVRSHRSELRIVCPFIKRGATERLLAQGPPATLRVITRFNLRDFYEGVSDTAALRFLLEQGAQIRGIRNLHAKLYLFDAARVIATSANLTDAGFTRNYEFGFDSDEPPIIAGCSDYFERLWSQAGQNLTPARLESWETRVRQALDSRPRSVPPPELGDEGAIAAAMPPPATAQPFAAGASQWFVKCSGASGYRVLRSMRVIDEVRRSGSHWACTYPAGKRPRSVCDGDVMFLSRLVRDPNDIIIYGRAIGRQHRPVWDDATEAEIALRPWKEGWPHYVRVAQGEFLAGTLDDGVSLNELMTALGSNAFASTARNARQGEGNTDPRQAYLRKPAVRLTRAGARWVSRRLEVAFRKCGTLTQTDMHGLDWPDMPGPNDDGAAP